MRIRNSCPQTENLLYLIIRLKENAEGNTDHMSRITGIIAEYNPFHKGHAYHLEKARELTCADHLIVVMSGDFVQRGAPALFDKYLRTRMALLEGADLVLELPVSIACASAEYFASGAVSVLDQLGCVNALCFGSESGDVRALTACAKVLLEEDTAYQQQLRSLLKKGYSFPAARKSAFAALHHPVCFTELLDSPNNILGLEYIKALLRSNSHIQPTALKRAGAGYHDGHLSGSLSSATAIRKHLRENSIENGRSLVNYEEILTKTMPESAALLAARRLSCESPVWEDDFSLLLRYRLMLQSPEELGTYADLSPELARRIHARLNDFRSFSQFLSLLKTRELTYTRISRALLHVLLNIKEDMSPLSPVPYARILGFSRAGSGLLREIKANTRIPLITKAADHRKLLSDSAQRKFEQDLFASNLYETVRTQKNGTVFVNDIQKPPVIL